MTKKTTVAPNPDHTPTDPITVLLARIDFSPDNVVQAATENPSLFLRAAEYRVRCMRERTAAKMDHERVAAEKGLSLRQEAREAGDRLTEGNLEALLLVDPEVSAAAKRYADADINEEFSKLILEAYRMRRDSLRTIGDLVREELSLHNAVEANVRKLQDTRTKLRERFPKEA